MRDPVPVAAIFICLRLKDGGEDERAKVQEDGGETRFPGEGRKKGRETDTEAGVSCSSFRIGVNKQRRTMEVFDFVE